MEHAIRQTATDLSRPAAPAVGLADFARKSWYILARMPEIRGRLREIDRLSAKSDAKLERRGLRLEDIVAEVFLRSGFF